MIDPVIGGAIVFMLLTGGTKTGRNAARNAAGSAYKATGWKPPKTAIVHHSGRAGEKVGAAFAATARKTRNAAVKFAERRWDKRITSDDPPGSHPPVHRVRPPRLSDPDPGAGASGRSPADAPLLGGGAHPPRMPQPDSRPVVEQLGGGPVISSVVHHDDDTYVLKPAGGAHATGGTVGTPRRTMTANGSGFSIDLEKPSTDAEFLESCQILADALRGLSKSVEEWAGDVSALGLPGQVTASLDAVAEGIGDAATGVNRAASTFEDIFEDPRDIAARGMKFTGEDAA
ncbi:hypothetical protein [Actinomadura napierensis]|uniref:WXG100 family type VII secretion target n=1 Tax=Actinomadura napierensis TaxID=267854 RepID=A0ABN2YAH2_9ACTN